MLKRLKTLEQIKKEVFKISNDTEGFKITHEDGSDGGFINYEMFELFGKEINVENCHNNTYDYYSEFNVNKWNFCKEWFSSDLFTDEDFLI